MTIRLKWAVVLMVIVVVGGGGWGALLKAATGTNGEDENGKNFVGEMRRTNDKAHKEFTTRLDAQDKAVDSIKDSVSQIRTDIIQDRASREAHRLTDSIRDAKVRQVEYDRLLRVNERRLRNNLEPCYTRTCGG